MTTITLRAWQSEALDIFKRDWRPGNAPVIRAVMGAGKSILMAALCREIKADVLGDVSDLISCMKAVRAGWPEVDA